MPRNGDSDDHRRRRHCSRRPARGRRRQRRAVDRQAARPRLDPRVLGVRRRGRRTGPGVGVVDLGFHPRRHRHADLRGDDRGHVRGQRRLPPGALEDRVRSQMDETTRPFDDLRLHRRQLHPVRFAGAARTRRVAAVLDRLGRCCGRGRSQDVLALGAALGGRSALPAPGLGCGVVHRAHRPGRGYTGSGPVDRRRGALQRWRGALRGEVA